jgi:hypothetical protein
VGLGFGVTISASEVIVTIEPSLFWINLPPVWLGFRKPGVFPVRGSTSRPIEGGQVQTWGSPDEEPREWIVIRGGSFQSANIPGGDWQHFSQQYPLWAGAWPNDPDPKDVIRVTSPQLVLQGRLAARGGIWSRTFWDRGVDVISRLSGPFLPEDGTERDPIDYELENEFIFTAVFRFTRAKAIRVTTGSTGPSPGVYSRFDEDAIPGYFGRPYNPQAFGSIGTRVEVYAFNPFSGTWMWWNYRNNGAQGTVHPGVLVFPWEPQPRLPPPPPPSLPPRSPALPEDPPMACDCDEIIKLLKKILKTLGADDLPWNLPNNLGSGEGGQQTITNYARLQIYHFTQLSHMLGQTKIRIKVKDTDLVEEGDQEQELVFQNISEALAEIAGMAMTSQSMGSATLNAALTGVVQSGMAFTTAAVIDKHIEEIIEFLGFSQKRATFRVPLPYTPGKSTPSEILKDTEVNLSYYENVDRRTFQSHAVIMEQAAAIIRAAFWERVGEGPPGAGDVKNKVTDIAEQTFGDFDTFLENVEQGFTGAPGATDVTPYGRPYTERPRIRKIGGTNENDGSNP